MMIERKDLEGLPARSKDIIGVILKLAKNHMDLKDH